MKKGHGHNRESRWAHRYLVGPLLVLWDRDSRSRTGRRPAYDGQLRKEGVTLGRWRKIAEARCPVFGRFVNDENVGALSKFLIGQPAPWETAVS